MKKLQILLATGVVAVAVALVYYGFEGAVHQAIDLIWNDWLDSSQERWLVVPLCLGLGLLFFGVQHHFDPPSERRESEGLGDMPTPTPRNLIKILGIGFLSLFAGASLGPEAVLVPACMVTGGYLGVKLLSDNPRAPKILAAAGLISLFAAFFHSFFIGLLALLLVKKQAGIKLRPGVLIVGVVASGVTVLTLGLLESPAFVTLPGLSWHLDIRSLFMLGGLVIAGYGVTYGLKLAHGGAARLHSRLKGWPWWQRALVASAGLSGLYLLGGSLVQFTGNNSIVPMLQDASQLGLVGLAWLVLVKITAISWSKAMGYRGGLVFPTIFVAATLAAMAQTLVGDLNFIYGLLAVMVGTLAADRKAQILL